jgi:tetratricopeptide (TPR) repeat protein
LVKISVHQALLKAQSHIKNGEIEEAEKLYQSVLLAFPKNVRAQQGLAALTKPKQNNVMQTSPQGAIGQLLVLYNKGQLAAVVEQAQALTEQYPEAFFVWNVLGAANKGLGRTEDAASAFKRVTELNPTYADGFNNLGVTLQEQGKLNEAIATYDKALSIKPDYAEAYNNMGNALKEQGKLDEAIAAYNKALSIKPDYAEAYNNMGVTLKTQGKLHEAIGAYNKALLIKPDHADAHYNMGVTLKGQGKLDEAIAAYNKTLSIKPDHADAYNNMGVTLQEQGKLDKAIAAYSKALSIKPNYADAYYNTGNALQEQGKLDKAIAAYNKALSIKPDYAEPHRGLSGLIKYKRNDPQISSVDELLKRLNLKDADRCHLLYAFAKMNEDLRCFDTAYDNYVVGGALRKKLLAYDLLKDRILFAKIREMASSLNDCNFTLSNSKSTHTPIFILGMPRSGTTLVEQIISCHSQVQGAGELKSLIGLGSSIAYGCKPVTADSMTELRVRYLDDLAKLSNGHQFVTDKMPHNFLYIALIFKALPEAKIIHVKRNPAATCWSNFKHYFSDNGLGYSYDLSDTVQYFSLYQELMKFWDDLYPDRIYHLDYDRLTVEQELETKQLLEHLGLDWEDDCLSPHKNKRSVRTASQQQVREKIYSGSSETWRKFEPYLNGVFDEF